MLIRMHRLFKLTSMCKIFLNVNAAAVIVNRISIYTTMLFEQFRGFPIKIHLFY